MASPPNHPSHSDAPQDVLTGSHVSDWFLFNRSGDKLTDLSAGCHAHASE